MRVRDLFGRQQCPCLTGMAGLGAALLAGGGLLRRRAMRIGRGRRRRIAGIGMQFLFQRGNALRQLVDQAGLFFDS